MLYDLRRKAEISIEVQLQSYQAFMNEFVCQPNPGQSVWLSDSSDSESSGRDIDMNELLAHPADESSSKSESKHRVNNGTYNERCSDKGTPITISAVDQALTNASVLKPLISLTSKL